MSGDKHIGKLIGNTGRPTDLKVALRDSYAARRGEFVRIPHTENAGEPATDCLGRIVSISRSNVLFSEAMGEGISEVNVLPGALVSGETLYGTIELVGFKDLTTCEIRMPRRPLDPGARVYGVDYDFLRRFYDFSEHTSLHVGNLVGYEKGPGAVPVFLDVNTLTTEHLAVLAMTGAGKSYTVGRIIERLVGQMNGTVVVFDTHGEYGRAFERGVLQLNDAAARVDDPRDRDALPRIVANLRQLQGQGGGVIVLTPQSDLFDRKYAGQNRHLALQFDHADMDDITEILPGLPEAQQRVLDAAIRQWRHEQPEPRDVGALLELLTTRLDDLRQASDLSAAEQQALGSRSAAIAAVRLRRVINEARSFYTAAAGHPTDLRALLGRRGENVGRLVIVDLQGLSDDARQVIVALVSAEVLQLASSPVDRTRPVFLVYEEGHNFAPAHGASISRNIIKRIAGEGRKFGVGFAIVSQRPSKLDADVTSQCNTIIAMRIKNTDDQKFITRSSDMFSQSDVEELPSLSTGEALICGRSIPAPLLVKIGTKALRHGGESPRTLEEWAPGEAFAAPPAGEG
jgi:hypothetical protein